VEIRHQWDTQLPADIESCPRKGKVVDMKNIELEVSNISLNVECPIRVCEGKVKPNRVEMSLGEC